MKVRSPVGDFPLSVTGVELRERRIRIRTAMGAWRSEVTLGREDAPLVAALIGSLVAAFALGRRTGRRRG